MPHGWPGGLGICAELGHTSRGGVVRCGRGPKFQPGRPGVGYLTPLFLHLRRPTHREAIQQRGGFLSLLIPHMWVF